MTLLKIKSFRDAMSLKDILKCYSILKKGKHNNILDYSSFVVQSNLLILNKLKVNN